LLTDKSGDDPDALGRTLDIAVFECAFEIVCHPRETYTYLGEREGGGKGNEQLI